MPEPYAVDVLRLDLIDTEISGNKWFKLKENLLETEKKGIGTVITFGGQHSNHIDALAAACQRMKLRSVGVVRGEQPHELSETLRRAVQRGMQLKFISRDDYRKKETAGFLDQLHLEFGPHLLIPEGGNNPAGLTGCMEIIKETFNYDYIFCACGTGTTFAGLVAGARQRYSVIGISVLKGKNELPARVAAMLHSVFPGAPFGHISDSVPLTGAARHAITSEFAFTGFAGYEEKLVAYKAAFENRWNIPLDHIYTTKLFYGVGELMRRRSIPTNSRLLVIHSGGLQGNAAFEQRYQFNDRR